MTKKVNIFESSPKPQNLPPSESEAEHMVFGLLLELGISPNLKGFIYLSGCILAVYRDKGLGNNIVAGLYADIANEHGTTPQSVERAIRHAIHRTKNHSGRRMARKYFGQDTVLTPKKLINLVADELRSLGDVN